MSSPAKPYEPELSTAWMVRAQCHRHPELPWIAETRQVSKSAQRLMESLCSACPVREACADFATDALVTAGFWAGESRNQYTVGDVKKGAA